MNIAYEELIGFDPIEIENVGHLKIPQLKDIWKIKYSTYEMLCSYISVDKINYLKLHNLEEQYDLLSSADKETNTLFNLIINNKKFLEIYVYIFSFFIVESVAYNPVEKSFMVYENDELIGKIDNSNFDDVRSYLLEINYLKSNPEEEQEVKYRDAATKRLAERLARAAREKSSKNTLSIGKIISKYCAGNKSGVNFLNVFDMTIYQLYDQWTQHNHIRQCDIQDMIYANTVTFSDTKSYDPNLWAK